MKVLYLFNSDNENIMHILLNKELKKHGMENEKV